MSQAVPIDTQQVCTLSEDTYFKFELHRQLRIEGENESIAMHSVELICPK
jgi:hypothetical protein